MIVVVSGATGALGREIVALLAARGIQVRALGRDPARLAGLPAHETRAADLLQLGSLTGICDGASALIIASGASMQLGHWHDRSSFLSIDYLAHLRLLAEARRSGLRRVITVSLAGALALRHTEYAQAHERFVQALAESGISHCVIRPTGFFAMFAALLPLARRGIGFVAGPGHARTNPVHEVEVAMACVDALDSGECQTVLGGPEVFSRLRLAELPFEALGRPPRILHTPPWLVRSAALPIGWANPRIAGLIRFGVAASGTDLVAPARGLLRLGDYLRREAAILRAEPTGD